MKLLDAHHSPSALSLATMKPQTHLSKTLIPSLLLFTFLSLLSPFSGELSGTLHLTSPAPTKLPSTSPLSSPTPPRRTPPISALPPASPHRTPPTSALTPASPHRIPPNSTKPPASPHRAPPTSAMPPASPHQTPPTSTLSPASPHRIPATTLDPKQLLALQSLGIPTSKDPCSSPENTTACDSGTPFRHITTLRLLNCSSDIQLSPTAMKSLSTLHTLTFLNCPIQPVRFPPELISNLESFTCINSLHRLTGIWLSRLANLTDLTVTHVPINASGPSVILHPMKDLRTVTIQRTNLTGFLPRKWHLNITTIDLSGNNLRGTIPSSLTRLPELRSLNLSSNKLTGTIPETFGDLLTIRNVSLASNSLSGPIPSSLAEIPMLVHLDLSSNQLNGSVPGFLAEIKGLKYLNLENNNFQGIVPFNTSFIKKLVLFKISGNDNLCYNHSTVSSKLKLGVAQCDGNGLPIAPPGSFGQASAPDDSGDIGDDDGPPVQHKNHSHGPSSVVLGVAIALSSIVFLIIFFVLLSKCCKK